MKRLLVTSSPVVGLCYWVAGGGMFVSGEIILFVIQLIKTNNHNSHLHQYPVIHSLFLSSALSNLEFRTFDSVILNLTVLQALRKFHLEMRGSSEKTRNKIEMSSLDKISSYFV